MSRKQLGLEFNGISRPSDRALVGDIYIKGLDFNVSYNIRFLCLVLMYALIFSIGTVGEMRRPSCECPARESRYDLWVLTDSDSMVLRPTEFQDLWAVILGGQVDLDGIRTNKTALIEFITEVTGRKDLVISEVKELNEYRSVLHRMLPTMTCAH